MTTATAEVREKQYDYFSYGKIEDGKVFGDAIGFVTVDRIREAKNGDVRSFGLPLENVQGTVAAMFPEDFTKDGLDETVWLNVAMFNNENFKLADRLKKAVDGKKRVRIRVSGEVRVHEYNGKKSVEMVASDFHILWADTYKGTNIGGGEDGYSYAIGRKIEEGKAQVAIQGFVSRPELRQLDDGRSVLGFGVALDKADKALAYALGVEVPSGQTTWVDVSIFDNDHFPRAVQAAKVVRSGAALALQGYATVEEYTDKEGNVKKAIRLIANDFEVLKFAAKDGEENASVAQTDVTTTAFVDESPFDDNADFDFDDDDLPF